MGQSMEYTVESAVSRLLSSFRAYYNITEMDGIQSGDVADETKGEIPVRAICEYYEKSQRFVVSQKAELWSEHSEEFLFLFQMERLTPELFEICKNYAYDEGMKMAHIGPGHMYTYITPIFVCESCDEAAKKALKKCRIFKSFRFSFHGWMDLHAAVLEVKNNQISSNAGGRSVEKVMKSVLFNSKKKRRWFLK